MWQHPLDNFYRAKVLTERLKIKQVSFDHDIGSLLGLFGSLLT